MKRELDADRLALLETAMWRSYYEKKKARLFWQLILTLREQYRLPYGKAILVAFHWARAAALFGDARGDYHRVLPDLERGYQTVRDYTDSGFDSAEVARAELAWWVARRTNGQSSPENVGRLIGELYAKIYAVPIEKVAQAGRLRAQAGDLRDQHADWTRVRELLQESYRRLHDGVR